MNSDTKYALGIENEAFQPAREKFNYYINKIVPQVMHDMTLEGCVTMKLTVNNIGDDVHPEFKFAISQQATKKDKTDVVINSSDNVLEKAETLDGNMLMLYPVQSSIFDAKKEDNNEH